MLSGQSEVIWRGYIHIGDEPGVYGNAFYAGLATELPLTLYRTSTDGADTTTLILEMQDVVTFAGYPGHLVTVTRYEPDPAQQFHWQESVIATERLTSSSGDRLNIVLNLDGAPSPTYLSLRVRVDTSVQPGLYDDFTLVRLSNRSPNFRFVASFGFHD